MHSNQCPYHVEVTILCRTCVENTNCNVRIKDKIECRWYDTQVLRNIRQQRDDDLRALAGSSEYASTMIDTINQVIFNENLDKGNPNDSHKARIQISLGEREAVLKELKAILRVLGLDKKDYVGLLIHLNKIKESRNVRRN